MDTFEFAPPRRKPILIVEDKDRLAKRYFEQIRDIVGVANFAATSNEAINFIEQRDYPSIYWVDIHLGVHQRQGLDVLAKIKTADPESLVIVYTAYAELRKDCVKLGLKNLHFFEKDASSFLGDMSIIRSLIGQSQENDLQRIVYYADIAHIDEEYGWMKLECYYDNDIFETTLPISPVQSALKSELFLDMCILITITQSGDGINVVFSRPKTIPPEIQKLRNLNDEDINDSDEMLDGEFWNNKD